MQTRPSALARTGILGLLAGGLASAAYQALGEARDRRRFPPPGELVDIDGRRLHLWRAGEGGPAVVIATSLGEPGHGWAELQRRLAQHTTVVLYDRAGLGWSDPGPWPTGKRTVDDLHALLDATRIPPPYVLVGHSAGGLHIRLYAARHPQQVAGLVLVDSSHPDQSHRLRQRCGGWRFSRPRHWLQVAKVAFRPLGLARLRRSLRARYGHGADIPPHPRRGIPRLAGAVVDVTLADMGGGMMGGPAGPGAMMGGGWQGMVMFRVSVSPGVVSAGTVSLRVVNAGVRTHELVVLPLPAGQAAGGRQVGAGGQVDEAGSLGEASRSCGAGAGDGIAAGATGWVTLTMGSGRYELVCNLPGHYAAGMYAELDVT